MHAVKARLPLLCGKAVAGHCQYATALHGQCRGRTAFQHQHSRDSEALPSGETVRALLTHSDNDPLHLVDEILSVCEDTKNKGAYYKAIKKYPEALIKMTLAETRQAALEGRILKNKGAFFMDTLKRLSHARA